MQALGTRFARFCSAVPLVHESISRRAYETVSEAFSWEELWEAGSYYSRISELLEDCSQYAVFVGWQVDSRVYMARPNRPGRPSAQETLKSKVVRLCEERPSLHVYFLIWDHAYFYSLEREALQGQAWLDIHPRVHFVFDNRHPFGGSHHEKVVIIDGKTALCGGIDVCDERWDSPAHLFHDPRRSLNGRIEKHGPYHDLAVQVTGPVVEQIQRHIHDRWVRLSSVPFPETHVHGLKRGHPVLLSRTMAAVDADEGKVPVRREIEFLFKDLLRSAQRRIIIEGQYYWSAEMNDLLITKIHEMRGRPFKVFVILADLNQLKALSRQMSAHELRLIQKLESAAEECGTDLVIGYPEVFASPQERETGDPPSRPIYVHSKVMVIDDQYLAIGSANFSSRAFRVDTELNLTLLGGTPQDRAHINRVAGQILHHWNLNPLGQALNPLHPIRLVKFKTAQALRDIRLRHPWAISFPWRWLFDPQLPWLYLLKRRYRAWRKREPDLALLCVLGIWGLGVFLCSRLAGVPLLPLSGKSGFGLLYCIFLASAWLVPLPFIAVALLCAAQLGEPFGPRIAVCGLWISAIWGYALCRMFPTVAGLYYQKTAPRWLPRRLGLRSFPLLIQVLGDFRVGLRSKIAIQGLYCAPVPWFVLGTLLLLPGALLLSCQAVARMTSGATRAWIEGHAALLLMAVALFGICTRTFRLTPKVR